MYANCLRPDIEYKTLSITYETTCREIVQNLLNKYRMRHRDPRLFYLTMEVTVRRPNVRTVLPLDEDARPAVLQSCHPRGDSRYCDSIHIPPFFFPRAFLSLGFARLRDVISGLATDRKHDFLWVDEHEPTTSLSFREREREVPFVLGSSGVVWLDRARDVPLFMLTTRRTRRRDTCSLKIFNRDASLLSMKI